MKNYYLFGMRINISQQKFLDEYTRKPENQHPSFEKDVIINIFLDKSHYKELIYCIYVAFIQNGLISL